MKRNQIPRVTLITLHLRDRGQGGNTTYWCEEDPKKLSIRELIFKKCALCQ
jgi:hypothetical protein